MRWGPTPRTPEHTEWNGIRQSIRFWAAELAVVHGGPPAFDSSPPTAPAGPEGAVLKFRRTGSRTNPPEVPPWARRYKGIRCAWTEFCFCWLTGQSYPPFSAPPAPSALLSAHRFLRCRLTTGAATGRAAVFGLCFVLGHRGLGRGFGHAVSVALCPQAAPPQPRRM